MMGEGYAERRAVNGDILQIAIRDTCINIVAATARQTLGRMEGIVTKDAVSVDTRASRKSLKFA